MATPGDAGAGQRMVSQWAASAVSADAVETLRACYCEETGGQVLHFSFFQYAPWQSSIRWPPSASRRSTRMSSS